MTPCLLVTRPQPLADETARHARALGFAATVAPLLDIEPLAFELPEGPFEALLFTSPQAPGRAGPMASLADVPVFAVGERTAAAARAADYGVAWVGAEDAGAALATMAARGIRRVLHLCGEDRAPAHVPDTLMVQAVPVYRAVPVMSLAPPAAEALRDGRIFATLLFSPRTARVFAALADRGQIDRSRQRLVAISGQTGQAAGPGWRAVAVSDQPTAHSVLGAAQRLWQGSGDDRG